MSCTAGTNDRQVTRPCSAALRLLDTHCRLCREALLEGWGATKEPQCLAMVSSALLDTTCSALTSADMPPQTSILLLLVSAAGQCLHAMLVAASVPDASAPSTSTPNASTPDDASRCSASMFNSGRGRSDLDVLDHPLRLQCRHAWAGRPIGVSLQIPCQQTTHCHAVTPAEPHYSVCPKP